MTGVQGMKSHQNRKPQGEAESGAAERGSNVEQGEPCGDLRNCWNRVKENHLAEVLGQEEQCMGKNKWQIQLWVFIKNGVCWR